MSGYAPQPAAPEENFPLALLLSIGIAVLGVVAWVILAETAQVRTAIIGFGVALGSAEVFRRLAPRHRSGPVVIVVVTVVGSLVGLLASQYSLLAQAAHISFFKAVNDVPLSKVPTLMKTGTDALTWIIIALSGYSGFQAAQRLRNGHRPRYGAPGPAPQVPGAQATAFGDLRAANQQAAAPLPDAAPPVTPPAAPEETSS